MSNQLEQTKVIEYNRTYIIDSEKQTPLLRINEVSTRTKTKKYKAGDKIKASDFANVATNKPQFTGWAGEKTIIRVQVDKDEWAESPTFGLTVQSIFV